MKFTKMHGAGNDFVIINNLEEHIPEEKLGGIAKRLCTRRLSVGADGIMVVEKARADGDYAMLFYNADGSLGEMCGNGARCICRYGYEHGLAGETQHVETTAGMVIGQRISERMYRIRLNAPTVMELHHILFLDGREYDAAYVELGDPGLPHCVIVLDNWDEMSIDALRTLGFRLRYHDSFPKGANISFVKVVSPTQLKAITFERGVEDFTMACGTGCGSMVSALALRGEVTGEDVLISMPGGDLRVTVEKCGGSTKNIYLSGPTNIVCTGEITDEDLTF